MVKIALITDTASDIPKEWVEKYNVHVLPFQIIYSDIQYRDQIDITSKEVFEGFEQEIPTTSMPSLEDMQNTFQKIVDDGYTHAIAITLSSGLSGCWNGINMVKEQFPQLETYVYDSRTISFGQAVLVKRAGEMIAQNKTIEEIIPALDRLLGNQQTFFIVGTLKYLITGGRIGHVSGLLGTVLNLKPIISIGEDGKYFTYSTVRGKNRALRSLAKYASEIVANKPCSIYVVHGDAEEEALNLVEKVKHLPNIIHATFGGLLSPVACVHAGPGFLGMVIVEE